MRGSESIVNRRPQRHVAGQFLDMCGNISGAVEVYLMLPLVPILFVEAERRGELYLESVSNSMREVFGLK